MTDKTDFQVERIAFFSDAVFAIAITLLVIEIHAPVFTLVATRSEALHDFVHLLPEIIAVLVTFALISLNWRRHHQLFGIVTSYDSRLMTINFVSLAAIIFLPFSTAFISKNYQRFWTTDPITLPMVVYCFNNFACALCNYLLFRHALDPNKKLYEPTPGFDAARIKLETLFPVFVFAVTVIVGYFNNLLALLCFTLFALEPVFIRLVLGSKKDGASDAA